MDHDTGRGVDDLEAAGSRHGSISISDNASAVVELSRKTGAVVVAPIPDTYYTMQEALELMFPVGSVYVSTSSTAPTFGGTWREIIIPSTWGDLEDGNRSYYYGEGQGTLHFWKRTA